MKKLFSTLCISALASSLSSGVNASNCYQPSPDLAASGDRYYDIVIDNKLNRDTRKKLKEIYSQLHGEWYGRSTETSCKRPDNKVTTDTKNFQSDTEIKVGSNGSLHVKNNRYWLEKRRRQEIKFHLFGPDGAYKLLNSDDENLSVSHKYRTATVTGHSLFREAISDFEITDDTLTMTISYYINGVLVSSEVGQYQKQ